MRVEAGDGAVDGYVTEIDYTHRYHAYLAPARIALACRAGGLEFRPSPTRAGPMRYLELAFGQGVSINVFAAASPGDYRGIDFNPRHADHAQGLARASGSQARLECESLEAFAARQDLPRFDVIAMHGTWSWISAENRHFVVEIVRKWLAPEGACVISYNCMPGWADELPLRHLLALHAELAPSTQSLAERIEGSLAFAQSLLDAGAKYFESHPAVALWLSGLRGKDRGYLAHEYYNRDWHPMPSSEVARAMAGAGLEFGVPARFEDLLDAKGLDSGARELLSRVTHPLLRETVSDYLANRRFRRDIFVKRGRHRDSLGLYERIGGLRFILLQHPDHVPEEFDRAFVAAMAADEFRPKTLHEISTCAGCASIAPGDLALAAIRLTEAGYLHPIWPSDDRREAEACCRALNARILERSGASPGISVLASAVTGAGVEAARQEMLFVRALSLGLGSEDEWAQHASETLRESEAGALRSDARAFARFRLPVFRALGIA